ncbi:hypothetical protein G6F40_014805 [Rhizopus arrhizus]|nr:hypothetical protein G6F40_014805 [Rhizopus arrhizus]
MMIILHDHDRPVHDDAEVQRAQAHQVGADLVGDHAGEGEQHRQGNDHGRDQRRPDIAQKDEQDDDDQRRALQQVLLDGGDGLVDQVGAVVDGHRLHALRQRLVDGVQPRGHGLRDAAAVLSDQHEHRAQHDFFAVVGGRARAQLLAFAHASDVAHPNGHAIAPVQHDVADCLQIG